MRANAAIPNLANLGATAYRAAEDRIASAAQMNVRELCAVFEIGGRVWSAADATDIDAERSRLLDAATDAQIAVGRLLAYACAGNLAEVGMKGRALRHLEVNDLDDGTVITLRASIEADAARLARASH